MDRLRKQDITNNKGKSNKKEARKQQKLEKKAKKFTETTQEKPRSAEPRQAAFDVVRNGTKITFANPKKNDRTPGQEVVSARFLRERIESSKEPSERSQLLHQPHEQITKLIEVRKEEKKSLESAFKDLQEHIETVKSLISKEKMERDAALQQDPLLNGLLLKYINSDLDLDLDFADSMAKSLRNEDSGEINALENDPLFSNLVSNLKNSEKITSIENPCLRDFVLKFTLKHIKKVFDEIIADIRKDLYLNNLYLNSTVSLIDKQIAIVRGDEYLNYLVLEDINNINDENKLILDAKDMIFSLRKLYDNQYKEKYEALVQYRKEYTELFRGGGIDFDADLITAVGQSLGPSEQSKSQERQGANLSDDRYRRHGELPRYPRIASYWQELVDLRSHKPHEKRKEKLLMRKSDKLTADPVIPQLEKIEQMRQLLEDYQANSPSRQKNSQETQGVYLSYYDRCKDAFNVLDQRIPLIPAAKQKFEQVIDQDAQAIREAYMETMRAYQEHGGFAWEFLNAAYLDKLKGKKIDKEYILHTLQVTYKVEKDLRQSFEITLESNDNLKDVENEQRILQAALPVIQENVATHEQTFEKMSQYTRLGQAISHYDFIASNIEYRVSNSLDEHEKKCQEALRFLDEQTKELELLLSQKQSKLSDQSQVAIEKPSPADKLQTYLETACKDADMTPECRVTVLSYLSGLFEKSHPQSLNDVTTMATFFEKNIEEAKQIGEYLEQKQFIHYTIRDNAIQLATHVKHAFGFPLYQAGIDTDFNIVELKHESAMAKLEINSQGKILKDGKVQRVYLIGMQDSSEASSSNAQPKPMVLLAMQSTDTGYAKYGAGTPLPTGGVVDVVTAQHITCDQPNLYKAALAIETLQETHDQKEIDMQTLELFETEPFINPNNHKVPNITTCYDVTTFIGQVKDKLPQALSEHSRQEKEYHETTGPCVVDIEKLFSAVKQELELPGRFRPSQIVMQSIKRQIARQVLGADQVPTSDKGWHTNDKEIHWADFHEYSTSMNMLAKYLMVAYRSYLH